MTARNEEWRNGVLVEFTQCPNCGWSPDERWFEEERKKKKRQRELEAELLREANDTPESHEPSDEQLVNWREADDYRNEDQGCDEGDE